jgi:hypothetical protein
MRRTELSVSRARQLYSEEVFMRLLKQILSNCIEGDRVLYEVSGSLQGLVELLMRYLNIKWTI